MVRRMTRITRSKPKPERTKHRTMKILVVYYSMYGHVLQLARAVEQGAKAVAGVDVILRRVAEFDDVIQKDHR